MGDAAGVVATGRRDDRGTAFRSQASTRFVSTIRADTIEIS